MTNADRMQTVRRPPRRRCTWLAARGATAVLLALAVGLPTLIGGAARAAAPKCEPEIVGIWRSADTAQVALLNFSAGGWANLLGGSPEQRVEDFDILAQVRYAISHPPEPTRLEFVTRRGNDLFPPGESSWEIVAFDDESFVARAQDTSHWTRVQTHRYLLTFADRAANAAAQDAATLAAWTSLDGRKIDVEAFGIRYESRDGEPRLGKISADLVRELGARGRESDVVLRVEVNAAEYQRSHRMLEAWATLASTGVLADDDPYRQALDFLQTVLESVNRCRQKIRLSREDAARLRDGGAPDRERLRELVRALRKENAAAHVDADFPAKWTPPSLQP